MNDERKPLSVLFQEIEDINENQNEAFERTERNLSKIRKEYKEKVDSYEKKYGIKYSTSEDFKANIKDIFSDPE
jgi:hypothetical protein